MDSLPSCSIIIPARDSALELRECLLGLKRSSLPPKEVIVVNDGSTDATATVAAEFEVTGINLDQHHGANYCRNMGANAATGDILLFLDSDVVVEPDTLQRALDAFSDKRIEAIVGLYSAVHPHPSLASQYKNLWIRYSYLKSGPHIDWIFGAVAAFRKDVFLRLGGFDDTMLMRYGGEDLELGKRFVHHNRLIRFEPSIEVIHLKRHTLKTLLWNDFRRSQGFVSLASKVNQLPRSIFNGFVNIYPAFVLSTILSWPIALAGIGSIWNSEFGVVFLFLLLLYGVVNVPFLSYLARERGVLFALGSLGILYLDHLVCAVGSIWGFLKVTLKRGARKQT